jgi:uncharacterized repeat protein (TIGR01451 family)
MPKFSIVILSIIGMTATISLTAQSPLLARPRTPRTCVDPLPVAKRVALTLTADKKVVKDNQVVFEPIAGKAAVRPGDIIKYTVIAKNNSHCPLRNLILKQAIPKGTNYVKDSATPIDDAELLFSIDGGKTFSANPTIGTQAASTTDYNYLRWKFTGKIRTNAEVKTTYKLQVK